MSSSANTEAKTSLYDLSFEMVDLWGNVMLILGQIPGRLLDFIERKVTMSSISDEQLQEIWEQSPKVGKHAFIRFLIQAYWEGKLDDELKLFLGGWDRDDIDVGFCALWPDAKELDIAPMEILYDVLCHSPSPRYRAEAAIWLVFDQTIMGCHKRLFHAALEYLKTQTHNAMCMYAVAHGIIAEENEKLLWQRYQETNRKGKKKQKKEKRFPRKVLREVKRWLDLSLAADEFHLNLRLKSSMPEFYGKREAEEAAEKAYELYQKEVEKKDESWMWQSWRNYYAVHWYEVITTTWPAIWKYDWWPEDKGGKEQQKEE